MVVSIFILVLGDLLSGFARTSTWLFITRGICGVGVGGINSLAMIIISDVVSLRKRGIYQGLTGAAVAVGCAVVRAHYRLYFLMNLLTVCRAHFLQVSCQIPHPGGGFFG
jgi:MFS family permease